MASADSGIASFVPFVLDGKCYAIAMGEYSGYLFCQQCYVGIDRMSQS